MQCKAVLATAAVGMHRGVSEPCPRSQAMPETWLRLRVAKSIVAPASSCGVVNRDAPVAQADLRWLGLCPERWRCLRAA